MQVDPYISKRDTYKIVYGDNTPAKLNNGVKMINRKKCIIIEDSGKPFIGNLHKKSSILSCRNPFRPDQENVNYDMDSEDEWAEANGEDLGEDNKSDEEEEDPEENQGFIVEDDYLSDCELNLSENSDVEKEKERRKVIIQKNKESKEKQVREQEPLIFMYQGNEAMMEEFKAFSFEGGFPIIKKKNKEDLDLDEEKKMGYDPNAINQYLPDLVRLVHGSFEPKHKILDEFNEVHPDCSKNSIEKKLKDFFIKDKRGEDPRQRYYANDEILSQLT